MSAEAKGGIRCAIYTRKSSEEGLEQSFNSLDAQREACQAFVASQREEGWRALGTHYDDGGFSGGTLNRPALKRLLEDVEAKKVDTIVVYKVDRLTRSLADFAKIVEALDARGVSFVSVTQQFNTTSSMGRLTLNVLLSFAQFEREVTGERIRDKIAASKKKGMWMGGTVSLGYEVQDRKLIVNREEAKLVNRLFRLYLELGCVRKLKAQLDGEGTTTRRRMSGAGNRTGGAAYARGALYKVLQNRIYLGEIHHRKQYYPGEHEAIVPRELWDQVQARLASNNRGHKNGVRSESPAILVGLLQDPEGNPFTPSHTLKSGRRYRYYIGQAKIDATGGMAKAIRLPAHDVERQVVLRLQSFLRSNQAVIDDLSLAGVSPGITQKLIANAGKASEAIDKEFLTKVVRRVVVHPDRLELELSKTALRTELTGQVDPANPSHDCDQLSEDDLLRLEVKAQLRRRAAEMHLVVPPDSPGHEAPPPVSSLLKAVARGRQWYEWILKGEVSSKRGIAKRLGLTERYVGRVLECAFLAPDIVESILAGRQPSDLTFQKLTGKLALSWTEQRKQLGFQELPAEANLPHALNC
jgi:DNA invertase Pin-like site-specific DNA recombinase